ncbi:hypothetical protein Sru01_08660 [Sphaerisporangium rufum]|uniref:DUF1349 domain-containing protein n=1 Tax=Sphaerisporangium rufum TaxID=1381558 RepID=A0A919UXI5_9ACTN|nr:DUF1349 domain-containing protein [Sphaerisporangium rufum]GII75884.1 hypothetical protein Sru01_08660 [Sphaerisporangium rufum]
MIDDFGGWRWVNEPADWSADRSAGGVLRVTAGPGTDLWQVTHYGYSFDTAHMYGRPVTGDARVRVTFEADYAEQYDQAGAVLRVDAHHWIKAGVEYVDGGHALSTVVTRDFSDWSVLPLPGPPGAVTLELDRTGGAVTVRYGLDGAEPREMVRLAYFPPGAEALAGVMCAAPRGGGFQTRFTAVTVDERPIS